MKSDITTGQVKRLLELLEESNTTSESLQTAYRSGCLADVLNPTAFLGDREQLQKILGLSGFPVDMDYLLDLRSMFSGKVFSLVEKRILEPDICFPPDNQKWPKILAKIFVCEKNVPEGDVRPMMAEDGYRPAYIPELAVFGSVYLKVLRQFNKICAVGHMQIGKDCIVPYLSYEFSKLCARYNPHQMTFFEAGTCLLGVRTADEIVHIF